MILYTPRARFVYVEKSLYEYQTVGWKRMRHLHTYLLEYYVQLLLLLTTVAIFYQYYYSKYTIVHGLRTINNRGELQYYNNDMDGMARVLYHARVSGNRSSMIFKCQARTGCKYTIYYTE